MECSLRAALRRPGSAAAPAEQAASALISSQTLSTAIGRCLATLAEVAELSKLYAAFEGLLSEISLTRPELHKIQDRADLALNAACWPCRTARGETFFCAAACGPIFAGTEGRFEGPQERGLEGGRLPWPSGMLAEFASVLPLPAAVACGIVVLSVHAALAEWDLKGLSTAWLSWVKKGAEKLKKPDLQEQRMEDALQKMMMEHYKRAIRYLAHFLAVVVLCLLYPMQQPDFVTVVQFVAVLVHYLCCWWVARSHLTFGTLRLLTVLSHFLVDTFFVVAIHVSEKADYNLLAVVSAALRVCGAAVLHDPPVFIPCQAWVFVVEVACYFGLEGAHRGPPLHFLCGQAVILALVCGVANMVQEWARTCIKASFQSADANLCLEGFQRVLRGVCDADVLLDDSFNFVGDNTRLRRVLATPTDLQGVKFTDLLDQEGRTQFEKFVRMPCNASQNPEEREEQDKTCSIPPCLRISLPSSYSRVGVDIFHVLVPRFLDAAGPLHLLAITEDPDTRLQPDATLGAIPEALSMYSEEDNDCMSTVAESEAACSKHSLSSSMLCRVHPVPELRELTMLVDASTDQQDVLQVHAKFKRDKNLPNDIHSCMPCLQTMLRPSDWLSIRMRVAKFAHEQCQVGSPDTHELPSVMLRRLDDQNKFLAANTVNLAPCRGQESSKKSSLVWVYVRDFVNDEAKFRMQPGNVLT
ncbi:unnamed protein product [Symbiodinium microadriaticum]|nr:unnamed protein product [Symbiodinium microadriaticum]